MRSLAVYVIRHAFAFFHTTTAPGSIGGRDVAVSLLGWVLHSGALTGILAAFGVAQPWVGFAVGAVKLVLDLLNQFKSAPLPTPAVSLR